MLIEIAESTDVLPFVAGTPVSLFWTILTIIMPIFKPDFYTQFSSMPIAIYDSIFYDGLAHEPNKTQVHPFAKRFSTENSFFNNSGLIWILMVILASKSHCHFHAREGFSILRFVVAQLMFWMYSLAFYFKLKQEERLMEKRAGSSKVL
jgi:hypothetical protein